MKVIRLLPLAFTALVSMAVTSYAAILPPPRVPETTSSALLLCGAITAIYLARRKQAK